MQVTAVEDAWNPELHHIVVGVSEAQDVTEPVAEADPPQRPAYFTEDQEPMNDGTYRTSDGQAYYRPSLRVADRGPGLPAGPDVWFQRDAQGALRLEWTLIDVPPDDAGIDARPFPGVFSARLGWDGPDGSINRLLDPPRLTVLDDPGAGPRFVLRGATRLSVEEAADIEKVMRGDSCRLEVDFAFAYEVAYAGNGEYERYLDMMGSSPDQLGIAVPTPEAALPALDALGLNADQRKAAGIDEDDFLASLSRFEVRDPLLTQWVPFRFDLNDDANRLVYVALHGTADLPLDWRKSAAGWVRDSGFPNTVYRLPDELRLAFDPALGTPHVITTLHTTGDGGTAGVRVLLRVAPWQDPRKVVQVRELAGARAAQVMIGPVVGATLRLGGSFPESIRVLGPDTAAGVAFSLADGVDLLMDLSLEYFQLLCGMIGSAVGLPGHAEVTLTTPADADDPPSVTVTVPLTLRMDTVHDLPVGVDLLATDSPSPTAVRITNLAGTPIRIGGCAAVFVQTAKNSVVPLGTLAAECTTPFPMVLDAGGAADLAFRAVDPPPEAWWSAVLVDLLDKTMVEDAEAMLLRANRLAGAGALTWNLHIQCPVFAATPPPQRWATLVAIEVELSAPGFDTTTVVLRPDLPAITVAMRRPLAALISDAGASIHTATYRVRNNYSDHQGQWTQPQQQSGDQLIVYPNQTEGD